MNPQRRRRLWLVLALVLAGGLATTLVAMALQRNVAYLYTPSEVLRGDAGAHSRFRLGGMVEKGSFKRASGSLEAQFRVTDGDAQLSVSYDRILPDLFREGRQWWPLAACSTASSSPKMCWPSTTKPICRRKWPTRWAARTASTMCQPRPVKLESGSDAVHRDIGMPAGRWLARCVRS